MSVYSNEILTSPEQCCHLLALVNPASVGQQVLAVTFLTSVDSLLCPTSIFSLPPSNYVILWTAITSRLFSSALLCQLTLSVISGTFHHSSTSGLVGDLVLRPFVWASRQNRQRDRLSGANINGNELLRIVLHLRFCFEHRSMRNSNRFSILLWGYMNSLNDAFTLLFRESLVVFFVQVLLV